jgi:hypothetical protein
MLILEYKSIVFTGFRFVRYLETESVVKAVANWVIMIGLFELKAGKTWFYFLPGVFKNEICQRFDYRLVIKQLIQKGCNQTIKEKATDLKICRVCQRPDAMSLPLNFERIKLAFKTINFLKLFHLSYSRCSRSSKTTRRNTC